MNDQQILSAIENFPANFETAIDIICDIYTIDYLHAKMLIENEHGPLYDNLPLLK